MSKTGDYGGRLNAGKGPMIKKTPLQDLDPGQDDGNDEGKPVGKEPVVFDALAETQGVDDLKNARPDEKTSDNKPRAQENPFISWIISAVLREGRTPSIRPKPPEKILISRKTQVMDQLGQPDARLAASALAIDDKGSVLRIRQQPRCLSPLLFSSTEYSARPGYALR